MVIHYRFNKIFFKIHENLNWHQQINNVAVKLNRANAMLS